MLVVEPVVRERCPCQDVNCIHVISLALFYANSFQLIFLVSCFTNDYLISEAILKNHSSKLLLTAFCGNVMMNGLR